MNNFSPNMLKTFDECEKKFFFKYIDKKSLPQRSVIFEKGKKIHALANYYLKGFDIKKMEKVLNAEETKAWERLKSNKYFKLKPLETEYNLSCKVRNYWVGGRLDALMNENSNYFILDYKTGNIPKNAEQDFQTITYLLCADKLLKAKKSGYDSLKFVYIGLKNGEEKEISLTAELKNQYEEKISTTCKNIDFAINSGVFKPCEDCKNCEYHKLCNL